MTPKNVYDHRYQGNLDNPRGLLDDIREYRSGYTNTATIALVNGETVFAWGIHRKWWAAEECDGYDRTLDALDAAIKMVEGETESPHSLQAENPQQSAEEQDCEKVTLKLDRTADAIENKQLVDARMDQLREDTARAITGFLLRYPDMCAMVRSATRDRDGGPMSQEQWGDDV